MDNATINRNRSAFLSDCVKYVYRVSTDIPSITNFLAKFTIRVNTHVAKKHYTCITMSHEILSFSLARVNS